MAPNTFTIYDCPNPFTSSNTSNHPWCDNRPPVLTHTSSIENILFFKDDSVSIDTKVTSCLSHKMRLSIRLKSSNCTQKTSYRLWGMYSLVWLLPRLKKTLWHIFSEAWYVVMGANVCVCMCDPCMGDLLTYILFKLLYYASSESLLYNFLVIHTFNLIK